MLSPGRNAFNSELRQLTPTTYTYETPTYPTPTIAPPFNATPTYNPTDWLWTPTELTLTAASAQEDILLDYEGNYLVLFAEITLPDTTNDHSLFATGVNPATGEATTYGILGGATPQLAIWYRPTWTATPTLIASQPWPTPDTNPHVWTAVAVGHSSFLIDDNNNYVTATITTNANGNATIAGTNGPLVYGPLTAQTANYPYPQPPDITDAYTAKYGALAPGFKIGLAMKYIRAATGEVSPMQSTLVLTT